eukprot:12999902-Alexandrium_andersonii.AAC.1
MVPGRSCQGWASLRRLQKPLSVWSEMVPGPPPHPAMPRTCCRSQQKPSANPSTRRGRGRRPRSSYH